MRVTQAPSESLHQYAFAKLKIIERCPVYLSEAQKIDYLLHGLREQHILAAIAANRPPTVGEFISTCTSLDKIAQHLHAKASPSPFAGSVLPPSQPFRAAKPAERQQPRSEQSTPQSSRVVTPKTRISELPAEQQGANYAAISAQYGAPAFRSGQDLSQAVCYQCHALGHLASKCPTRTSRLSSSAPPTMPKTQQPPALHSPVPKTAYNVNANVHDTEVHHANSHHTNHYHYAKTHNAIANYTKAHHASVHHNANTNYAKAHYDNSHDADTHYYHANNNARHDC
ncbi:hypothetical protein HPB52_009342 [Rhipicephalus sanguineus]|uniref:CCHC-type domain-containing protein n=1 Tax=Rhipicephalus sanguineus TaxID=34632 RepID=A0A9D4Q6M5_RHISA|nr:hypothetical protein HPB52_009342 [Rhipicephalus sanguineus]